VARILLKVAYEGSAFVGWQSQSGGRAVQDLLEQALTDIVSTPIRLHGAGRTDAGVHALGQCAHFDVPEGWQKSSIPWVQALNARLPHTLRVLSARRVPLDFHARFSATGKHYRYWICDRPVLSPLLHGRAWHLPGVWEADLTRRTLALFEGEHDFRSFCIPSRVRERRTVRTLSRCRMVRDQGLWRIDVCGNGFLYRMVRSLVGISVQVGRGKLPSETVAQWLADPQTRPQNYVSPAEGLFLMRVFYPR
jgi:tRNA pseudouridine38-40 synthase